MAQRLELIPVIGDDFLQPRSDFFWGLPSPIGHCKDVYYLGDMFKTGRTVRMIIELRLYSGQKKNRHSWVQGLSFAVYLATVFVCRLCGVLGK